MGLVRTGSGSDWVFLNMGLVRTGSGSDWVFLNASGNRTVENSPRINPWVSVRKWQTVPSGTTGNWIVREISRPLRDSIKFVINSQR